MRKRRSCQIANIFCICILISLLPACSKNNSNSENALPKAVLEADTTRGDTSTIFHFDASQSTDKEDPIASLQVKWNFMDGDQYSSYTTTKTIAHSFSIPGIYNAKLVVKDTQGLVDSASQMIVVVYDLTNQPPGKPVYISPDNNSTDIPTSVKLVWLCDDPENDLLTYDVYIGYDPNTLFLKVANISGKDYTTPLMDKGTAYFWRIDAHDSNGNYTIGDVWKFTTTP